MAAERVWTHTLVLLTLVCQLCSSNVYMIMEYNTDGTVILNNANFTLHTLSIDVKLLGCDYGYYDYYLMYPPASPTPKTVITPFDCRPCVCTEFDSVREEDFYLMN